MVATQEIAHVACTVCKVHYVKEWRFNLAILGDNNLYVSLSLLKFNLPITDSVYSYRTLQHAQHILVKTIYFLQLQ